MSEISAGVQILIDQLKTNPEDFFGQINPTHDEYLNYPGSKFGTWKAIIEDDLLSVQDPRERLKTGQRYTWFLTEAEKTALVEAYREARRVRFDAEIIAALHSKPALPSGREAMRVRADGAVALGAALGWGDVQALVQKTSL